MIIFPSGFVKVRAGAASDISVTASGGGSASRSGALAAAKVPGGDE